MNDSEFRRRALVNPRDTDPAFLAAAGQCPTRWRLLAELRELEEHLEAVLDIRAPDDLRQRLLDPERLADKAGTAA